MFFFVDKNMSKYYEHATTFLSYDAIKNGILYNDFKLTLQATSTPLSIANVIPKTKKPGVNVLIEKLHEQKDIMLIIQNNPKILSTILHYRKQKSSLAYIYTETNNNIVIMIKKPSDFPLVIIRVPIDGIYNYASTSDKCYEFPIHQIQLKNVKFSKNLFYNIAYKTNPETRNVDFSYTVYDKEGGIDNVITISSIKVDGISLINNLLMTQVISVPNETFYINKLLKMNIIIMKELPDFNTAIMFANKNDKETKTFELTEDKFIFAIDLKRKTESKELIRKEEAKIWNNFDKEKKIYEIEPYENLFKSGFLKTFTQYDKAYYLFTHYLGLYLFIKIITNLVIDEDRLKESTFDHIFNGEQQMIECYACKLKK